MFSKREGFSWVVGLIDMIFIGFIILQWMILTTTSCGPEKASTLISQLRNAKAGAIMFFKDNTDLTSADLLSIWPTLNAGGTSFDQYMDNVNLVRQLVFVIVYNTVPNNDPWFMVGKKISDPKASDKMIGMAGAALYNAAGGAFTRDDGVVFMRVK